MPDGPTPIRLESHPFVLGLALVVALTLSSCCSNADTPSTGEQPALDTAGPAPPAPPPPPPRELTWSMNVDMTLWSPGRVKAYQAALQRQRPATLGIPRLKLEVPVYDGTADERERARTGLEDLECVHAGEQQTDCF